jgi:hypothetical protein
MNTLHYRQGDVLIKMIDELPEGAVKQKDKGTIALAHGSSTGHTHAISTKKATRYEHDGVMYLDVKPGAELVHEEHGTIKLESGFYKKVQQREYSPEAIRNVFD